MFSYIFEFHQWELLENNNGQLLSGKQDVLYDYLINRLTP